MPWKRFFKTTPAPPKSLESINKLNSWVKHFSFKYDGPFEGGGGFSTILFLLRRDITFPIQSSCSFIINFLCISKVNFSNAKNKYYCFKNFKKSKTLHRYRFLTARQLTFKFSFVVKGQYNVTQVLKTKQTIN